VTWCALYLVALLACIPLYTRGVMRPLMLLAAPLFVLDCCANVAADLRIWPPRCGSIRGTLSATAWRVRAQPFWGWTHRAIDALFFWQPNHCQVQQVREARYGSAWAAWRAGWRGR
jgi:hypothetical protein